MTLSPAIGLMLLLSTCFVTWADGPADNRPDQVRRIPPPGNDIDPAVVDALRWRCKAIRSQWETLIEAQEDATRMQSLASEILVFPRAVELAIEFGQFYKPNEKELASRLLDLAAQRLKVASQGGDWIEVMGLSDGSNLQLVVGGYRSKIDGSYQPYGLVLPRGLGRNDARPRRLDVWFHGRGEKLSEVAFLSKQQSDAGQYTPVDTIVLHPYGRYSNAFKFAGETDVLEALEYVQARLPVDPKRISVRGFSMGGAACWQFATHYADRWFAANPGAGFSETPQFLESFQAENVRDTAPDFQQTLWQLYDCPPWATNLTHCPTVAYSGELDRQKQAADVMAAALEQLGIDMLHIIGPNTAHKIHPMSKVEIESRMTSLAEHEPRGIPDHVEFVTPTLHYHRMHWVDVRGLGKHWTPARVTASIDGSTLRASTENVTQLAFLFEPGQWSGSDRGNITVDIDGTQLVGPPVKSDRSWQWELMRDGRGWRVADESSGTLRKRPGLQGPIDDAFMDSFLFVLPSNSSSDETLENWIESESTHAMLHWRMHFRGDIRKIMDTELTDADIKSANLVLFGDPESNAVIRLLERDLPVKWNDDAIVIGEARVPRVGHAPALIFPNPMNPDRYIVINSGFTFREYDYLNNARQTPKLPDWALIDIREGATSQQPGIIRAAGFFDERWRP